MKLYLITCKFARLQAYVAANDPTEAYNKYRKHLDLNNIGYVRDRKLDTIKEYANESKEINGVFLL